MISAVNASPVVKFKLDEAADVLTGYAAPNSGGMPCVLKLVSDGRPILYSLASGFSETAMRDGFRGGWCAFRMAGVAKAFAIGDRVQLLCAVSDQVQADIAFDPELMEAPRTSPVVLTPTDIIMHARADEMSPDLAHILPFAAAHLDRHGPRAFLEASYLTLLRRWPDDGASFERAGDPGDEDDHIAGFLKGLIESAEFEARWSGQIPGPFHPSFRYGWEGLI